MATSKTPISWPHLRPISWPHQRLPFLGHVKNSHFLATSLTPISWSRQKLQFIGHVKDSYLSAWSKTSISQHGQRLPFPGRERQRLPAPDHVNDSCLFSTPNSLALSNSPISRPLCSLHVCVCVGGGVGWGGREVTPATEEGPPTEASLLQSYRERHGDERHPVP